MKEQNQNNITFKDLILKYLVKEITKLEKGSKII